MQAAWYKLGPVPGAPGPAVILGHVDGQHRQGIFARLKELSAGDRVNIKLTNGRQVSFVVTAREEVPKAAFPTDKVYGDTNGPELRLITCGGTFDHAAHSYRGNIIVYAKAA